MSDAVYKRWRYGGRAMNFIGTLPGPETCYWCGHRKSDHGGDSHMGRCPIPQLPRTIKEGERHG